MPRKVVTQEQTVSRPIVENVEVERPVSSRGKWEIDQEVMTVIETAETGKARRLHMSESAFLHKIHMAMRHALKGRSLSLHYKKIDDRTLVAWAEKAKKTVGILALLSLFMGCALSPELRAAEARNRSDHEFTLAWNQCIQDTKEYGLIPDWGMTREARFFKCMEEAGWVQTPRFNAAAIGRYHRAP